MEIILGFFGLIVAVAWLYRFLDYDGATASPASVLAHAEFDAGTDRLPHRPAPIAGA